MRLVAGDLVPDVRNLGRVAIMVVVFATIGYLANQVWDTNFWFLHVGAPGSPLEGIQVLAVLPLRACPDRSGGDLVDLDVPAVGGARPAPTRCARRAGAVGASGSPCASAGRCHLSNHPVIGIMRMLGASKIPRTRRPRLFDSRKASVSGARSDCRR